MTIGIYTHPDCLQHDTGPMHPENAGRLTAILDALQHCSYADRLEIIEAPLAKEENLLLAHTSLFVETIKRLAPSQGHIYLDPDTVMSPGTLSAALRAAGSACAAVDDVMAGKYSSAFCATRPPGHHASRDQAMGFCIFNNIAIAALYAQKQHALRRIAIVDFDVHHGNGTEEIVADNQHILYISTHQSPLFPGTGEKEGHHRSNIINLPLPSGTDGKHYRRIFEQAVIPALEIFKPQLLLVSAGFDGHRDDPLASFNLVEDDYSWISGQLNQIAQQYCNSKVISILEGGYNHQVLAGSVVAYLSSFITTSKASATKF